LFNVLAGACGHCKGGEQPVISDATFTAKDKEKLRLALRLAITWESTLIDENGNRNDRRLAIRNIKIFERMIKKVSRK